MKPNKTHPTSIILIFLFFFLFAGLPGYVFFKAYKVYSLGNLPILSFKDFQTTDDGSYRTGMLILEPPRGTKTGDKLASYFIHPYIRRYRRFDQPIQPIPLFDGKAVLNMSTFPDRFDYGPDLGALSFMMNGSKLENTLTRFIDKGWAGVIRKYATSDNGFRFTDYTVILDSLSGNRTMVVDTIFVETGATDALKPDFYSFDSLNFSGSRTYYTHKIVEKGLAAGDTLVGVFHFSAGTPATLTPTKIFCYGHPDILWKTFFHDNVFFLVISGLLLSLPTLVVINLIRQKLRFSR